MKTANIVFLGCGGFMGAHAQRLKNNKDTRVVGLCDTDTKIVESFIDRHFKDYAHGKPAVFTDPAAMYKALKPDAVFIATPHTLHFKHGMQALDHGLHVYMEKPMVTASPDAHTLAAHAKKKKKIVVVGYNTPCTPEFHYLREAVRNNTFGKLELVAGWLTQNWMKLTVGTWRQKPELSGGGQAYDSGAHLLNSLCWTVESDIAEVFAFIDNHGCKVDINSAINIRFANGTLASIAVGGNCNKSDGVLTFIFESGKVDIDGWGGSWIKASHGDGKDIKYPPIIGAAQTPDDNFVDAILGRAEPRTSPRNGIIQSELMDAIYESARTGKPSRPKKRS